MSREGKPFCDWTGKSDSKKGRIQPLLLVWEVTHFGVRTTKCKESYVGCERSMSYSRSHCVLTRIRLILPNLLFFWLLFLGLLLLYGDYAWKGTRNTTSQQDEPSLSGDSDLIHQNMKQRLLRKTLTYRERVPLWPSTNPSRVSQSTYQYILSDPRYTAHTPRASLEDRMIRSRIRDPSTQINQVINEPLQPATYDAAQRRSLLLRKA